MRARRPIFRWLFIALLLGTTSGAYAWAYFAVPLLRCDKGGMQTVHMRCFARDFQPYFFAPAARIEALAIRIRRRFVSTTDFCGEVVQLCTTRVDLRFRATADFPPIDAPLPYGTDILTFAEAHPPFGFFPSSPNTRKTPDGTVVACKYLYCETDEAEEFLSDKYERPYTVGRVLRWYEEECDLQTRANLLVVLAASRDPRAALVLEQAMRSDDVHLRLAAVKALNQNFGATACSRGGNLESAFFHAEEWLAEHQARLRSAARRLPAD